MRENRMSHTVFHEQGQSFAVIIGGKKSLYQKIKSCEYFDILYQTSTFLGNLVRTKTNPGALMAQNYSAFYVFESDHVFEKHSMKRGTNFEIVNV